jgi:hypothetical protein
MCRRPVLGHASPPRRWRWVGAALLCAAAAQAQERGFGGAPDEELFAAPASPGADWERAAEAALSAEDPDDAPDDLRSGGGGTAVFPSEPPPPPPRKKTLLEEELARAGVEAADHPLLLARLEVALLKQEFKDKESRGLSSVRDVETRLLAAEAVLADIELVARNRMQNCAQRLGLRVQVKNYRMTPAGPRPLTREELMGQASYVDPEGCNRILLVDQPLVDRVKRAHALRALLHSTNFPYHRIEERRALEREQRELERALAGERLPALALPGALDPHAPR